MDLWGVICDNSQSGQENTQSADRGLDPFNSLLWYNPIAANAFSSLNQEFNINPQAQAQAQAQAQTQTQALAPAPAPAPLETQKIDKDLWTQYLVEEKGSEKNEKQEMKTEWMSHCHSPVAQSVRSQEDQHSEICNVEEHLSEISDGNANKTTSVEGDIADSGKIIKKRKIKTEKGPRYAFKTRSETDVLEDGYKWRKYGRKLVKSSPHPRSYYRCSESNCSVKKRVERDPSDEGLLITTYEGTHNHESPSIIYYIGKPIVLPQQGAKPAIVLVNASICPEPLIKYTSHQAAL